jgi:signal transduction histidine kinase
MRRFSPYYENGELQYVVGYGVNITQLKKAKDQLAEKEIYLRTLLHSIPDLILRVNASGSLLDFKAAPGSSLADRLSNFKNRTLHELWKEKAEFHMRYVAEAIANNAPVFYEYDITDTSGAIRVFEVRVYNNGREEVVMIVREVTKKKKAEAEREKLITELHHRNNELMQFSNILSHNFRAPLANILGLTGLLNSTVEEEERHKIYDYIKHSAESMDQLIRDLNSILSTKSALNTRKEVFSMTEVVASVQEHLSAQIEETGAMLQIEIEQAADRISSVKSYVQSAVFNLVSNAIKYRKEGRRPQIHLTARRIDEQIRICVSDNGIGVDLAKHGKEMFGLYKRFNVEKEGKGLGLHMTKTQIEALGGSISITSNPGEGTEFTICLPQ